MLPSESLFTTPAQDSPERLHVRRFVGEGPPILLLHGSVENGRIFYTDSGRGLASYLARNGHDVYVCDLRRLVLPPMLFLAGNNDACLGSSAICTITGISTS